MIRKAKIKIMTQMLRMTRLGDRSGQKGTTHLKAGTRIHFKIKFKLK